MFMLIFVTITGDAFSGSPNQHEASSMYFRKLLEGLEALSWQYRE